MRCFTRAAGSSRRSTSSVLLPLLLAHCGVSAGDPDASTRDAPAPAVDASGPLGAATCAAATPVRDGLRREGETLDGAEVGVGCLGAVRSVAYRVTVPAGQTLSARVPSAEGPVVLQVLEGCEATRCLAQSSTSGVAPLRALWRNASGADQEVRVLAGSFSTWRGRFAIELSLEDSAANLRCDDAELLEDGAWRGEQRFGPDGAASALCADRRAPAAAGLRWYRVVVPPRSVAAATITPGPAAPGREFGVGASMRSDCSASACLASTPVLLRGRSSVVGANDGDAPRELRLAVGVYPPQAEGTYSLALAIRPRDEAARCDAPEALEVGREARGDTALSAATLPLCGTTSEGGPVRFHAVTVPPRRFLELRGAADDGSELALRALASCADARCVAQGTPGSPSLLRVPNLSDAPLRVLVAAGARDPARRVAYTLSANVLTPDPAGACEGAQPFTARSLSVDTFSVAGVGPRCGASEDLGPARWLRLTVPARTAMRLTATSINDQGRAVPVSLRAVSSCDASQCLAAGVGQIAWANTDGAPQDVLLAVGATEPGVRGAFAVYTSPQPLAPNSLCEAATSFATPGRVTREQSTQSLVSAPWCDGAPRYARWYATTVPAGQTLHAWAKNPFSTFSSGMPALALRPGCGEACAAEGGAPGNRGSHLWWTNDGDAPREVRLQAGWQGLSGSYYDIQTEAFAATPSRCADAEALTLPASVLVGEVRGEAAGTACAQGNRSPVRWFRATVRAGGGLRVSATGPSTAPPQRVALGVHDGCDGACLAPASAETGATVSWRNEGSSPREVAISLHAADDAPLAGITLTAAEN
ncbi:MAG: hypothetical protein R3A48_00440 [Polyangiales bacterium]